MNMWDTPLGKSRLQELAEIAAKMPQGRIVRRGSGMSSRQYATARNSRTTAGWSTSDTSADAELISSITQMRSRSRALCRDNSYAKRIKTVVVNNVIGSGIGMQAQVMTTRDVLNERVNEDIEYAWCEWSEAENCHTGGRLSFPSLERALMAQVFEAGEVYVRIHLRPFGPYGLPFALELIEAERIADDITLGTMAIQPGHHFRLGLECDEFYKPVAYFIRKRHRGEIRFSNNDINAIERVPADQIIPLAVIDRWPQSRGEPWMHTVATRLNDMDGYIEAEVLRARSQAVRMGIITSADDAASFADEQDDGSFEIALEPNSIARLNPGETWVDSSPTAPNPNVSEFMRYMLREICAGSGPSYSSTSRDYSQATYSSERVAQLDDRDLWRFNQRWFMRDFRKKVHRAWLQPAVLSGKIPSIPIASYALDPRKFEEVLFKPRGWSWIDPTSEVDAYVTAIKNGLTTVSDVVAQTAGGLDIEDILRIRARELQMMKDAGLVFETSPEFYMADANKAKAEAKAAANPPEPSSTPAKEDSTKLDQSAGGHKIKLVERSKQ